MILAIAKDGSETTKQYIKACNDLKIKYFLFTISDPKFLEVLSKKKFNFVLWHPDTPKGKADSIFEKVYLIENVLKKKVYPTTEMSFFYQDKIRQTELFSYLKLPIPKTLITNKNKQAENWLKKQKFPLVLKDPYSSGGHGCLKINNLKEALKINKQIFSSGFYRLKNVTYYQEFLNIKEEYRIVTFCKKIVLSYKKIPAKDHWVSNIGFGGKVVFTPAPEKVLKIVKLFIKRYPWIWNSFDLVVLSNNQVKILEINPTFGAKVAYKNGVDLRKKQIEEVLKFI